ncbi:hypothetical protein BCR43DRAFT_511165 [Syncephalastrum racemosum]|uniref:Uncharacterized protein n=1 Tax=Syncephalastrum racemosum TaxID=13706 RepID=A0A1X2HML0_SYNRA|nr:hypothetical protein BCR43DRAFT_511165 [Syncephalastrum racemosum]
MAKPSAAATDRYLVSMATSIVSRMLFKKSAVGSTSTDKVVEPAQPKKQCNPQEKRKFLNDPMRNTASPDQVGHYYDPMSIRRQSCSGVDPTHTGA